MSPRCAAWSRRLGLTLTLTLTLTLARTLTLTLTLALTLTLTLRCDGWLVPLVTLSLLFVLLVIMICSYVTFMEKHEDLMTTVVTTFSILISHVQTLSIITNLRLAWPESVETVTWLG